jgi:hypothetical protein
MEPPRHQGTKKGVKSCDKDPNAWRLRWAGGDNLAVLYLIGIMD